MSKPDLEQCKRHKDGRLTLGAGHVYFLGAYLGHKHYRTALADTLENFDTSEEGLAPQSRQALKNMISGPRQRIEPENIPWQVIQSGIEASHDVPYRAKLKERVTALAEALKTLNDAFNVQMDSQGGPIVIGPKKGGGWRRFLPKRKRQQDDAKSEISAEELALSRELLEDAGTGLEERAAAIRNNGITLPREQADALLGAQDTILDIFAEQIFAAARAGNTDAVETLGRTATDMLNEAEYIKTLDQSRGR